MDAFLLRFPNRWVPVGVAPMVTPSWRQQAARTLIASRCAKPAVQQAGDQSNLATDWLFDRMWPNQYANRGAGRCARRARNVPLSVTP
jgi:hypothetical protein